jgi:hypothetical protein
MEANETTLISGRILAEFEEDASQFLVGESEYVSVPTAAPAVQPAPIISLANAIQHVKPT